MAKLINLRTFNLISMALVVPFLIGADKARKPSNEISVKLDFVKAIEFPVKHDFKKTRVGGISGLVYDPEAQILWAISDDRGKFSPPRIYKLRLNIETKPEKDFKITFEDVIFVKDKGSTRPVFDLEGISLLPWGNFLLTSEGDDRARPPRPHRIFEVKPNGDYVRDYDLPDIFRPGKGVDPKGLRTNFGFEALGMSLDGKSWILGSESWLAQDSENVSHLVKYEMKEAWVLSSGSQWLYKPNFEIGLVNGLTDILNWKEDRWLFIERAAHLDGASIRTQCQILVASLAGTETIRAKPVLDLTSLKSKNIAFDGNYEAMTLGPEFEGLKTLIVASDNNFSKAKTQFLLFKISDEAAR